jgi:hypothetical protein
MKDFFEALFKKPSLTLIVLGGIFIIVAATGIVPIPQNNIPIRDEKWSTVVGLLGLVLVLIGLILLILEHSRRDITAKVSENSKNLNIIEKQPKIKSKQSLVEIVKNKIKLSKNKLWHFDFFDMYDECIKFKMPESEIHKNASCGGNALKALWAEPPPGGDIGWYLYKILPPKHVLKIQLNVSFGVRDGIRIPYGTYNRFQIKINNDIVLNQEMSENKWKHHTIDVEMPSDGNLDIYFITKSTGRGDGHGAVWGEPFLQQVK